MLKAIKKTRLYEEVVGQLHQLIDDGKLKAGDRLPQSVSWPRLFASAAHRCVKRSRRLRMREWSSRALGVGPLSRR